MTSTIEAREAWSELLKEMYAETGIYVNPNLAGQRAMHRLAEITEERDALKARLVQYEGICIP